MTLTDILGFIGVTMLLIAYFLNVLGRISSDSLLYILLNIFGAAFATISSILMLYYPFIILEGMWTLVSLVSFFKYLSKQKNAGTK